MNDKYILQYGSLAGRPYWVADGDSKKGVDFRNYIFYDLAELINSAKLRSKFGTECRLNVGIHHDSMNVAQDHINICSKVPDA
ncbi:MAG: hypothetical protein RPT25_15475 [Cycloclasticus sp.]|jgi:hypothetical protein